MAMREDELTMLEQNFNTFKIDTVSVYRELSQQFTTFRELGKESIRRLKGIEENILDMKQEIAEIQVDGFRLNKAVGKLEADMVVMRKDVDELKADMVEVKRDVSELKADMAVVKQDVNALKADMVEVKRDVSELKADMVEVKQVVKEGLVEVNHSVNCLEQKVDSRFEVQDKHWESIDHQLVHTLRLLTVVVDKLQLA